MAKRKTKTHGKARYFGRQTAAQAQLESLLLHAQRLLAQGNAAEAAQLLEANARQLSQYAAYQALLASSYSEMLRFSEAVEHARLALDLEPQNQDYLLLAAISYYEAGYYSYAHRLRERWLRLSPHGPALADMRILDQVYRQGAEELRDRYNLKSVDIAVEAGYRLDEGRWALDYERWEESLRHSRAASELVPRWPPPRNNIAAALFYLHRYDQAIAESEAVLRECGPDNLHALSNLVHFNIVVRNVEAANHYADLLVRPSQSLTLDEAIKAVEGLAFLDRDEEIAVVLEQVRVDYGALPPGLLVHQAIVEANRGRPKKAMEHLSQARAAGVESSLLKVTMEALQAKLPGPGLSDRYPHTSFNQLIDQEELVRLAQLIRRDEEEDWRDQRRWDTYLKQNPQVALVLRRMLYEFPHNREATLDLLGFVRTPEAIEAVREFGLGEKGTLDERTYALRVLQEIGELPPNVQVDMWVDGQRQPIQLLQYEISDLERPDYPEAAWLAYELGVRAHQEDRLKDAERHYRAMLKAEPRAKEAYNNLFGVYTLLGDEERAEACLEKALEIDPLYSFARTTRAMQALRRDDIEAAKAWLEPLATVTKWHPQAFSVFHKVKARVAMAEENYDAAAEHLEIAKSLYPTEEINELLTRVALLKVTGSFKQRWRENADRYRQRRQKGALPSDPTLADCFGLLTKDDMAGICRVLRITGSGMKKAELAQHLMQRLADPSFLDLIVDRLSPEERDALGDVLNHGGVMDWQAFADAHGHDLEESPYLAHHAEKLKTTMGRLRARGLLFEGTSEGHLIVAIPRELRPLLGELLD